MMTKNQSSQNPTEMQKQINILNTRISSANLAYSDLLKEINNTFNYMTSTIGELQKENVELKSKLKESTKKHQKL